MPTEKTPLTSSPPGEPQVETAAPSRLHRALAVPGNMSLKSMAGQLLRNLLPAAGTTLLFYGNQTITVIFVARHLGTHVLAQYSIGQSIASVCGLSLLLGMATGLDTLCAQSFGRHKRGPELGEILQRGLLICLASFGRTNL
jgi:MATE family multidrug resistance protein